MNRGDLARAVTGRGVRAPIVVRKRGNARGVKGCRKVEIEGCTEGTDLGETALEGATDVEAIRGVARGGFAQVKPGRAEDDLVTARRQARASGGRGGRRRVPTNLMVAGAEITDAI